MINFKLISVNSEPTAINKWPVISVGLSAMRNSLDVIKIDSVENDTEKRKT